MASVDSFVGQQGARVATAVPDGGQRRLADLAPGTRATVVRVVAPGSQATARRLNELGFTPGTVVEVVRRAPLRDPVIYRVKDYEICLRRSEAAYVRTEPAA
jgi:ferrous iron transport protein A